MPKPVITFVFQVLCNALLPYILQHFTHAQTCDNVRVPSVKQCTASILSHARACDNVRLFKCYAMHWFGTFSTLHVPKPVITFVFQVWRNALLRHILYKVLSNALLRYILHTCPMPEPMKRFGFKVLRSASLRHTHSLSWTFVFTVLRHELLGRILSHAQACDNVRVPSATQCTASVHIQHFTHAQTCDKVRVPSVKHMHCFHTFTCPNLW